MTTILLETDARRDDSPSSIDAIKRAIARSPIRRHRRRQANNVPNENRWLLKEDYRGRLPSPIARFIGYRPPSDKPPYKPISPLSFLRNLPLKYEVWFFGWLGSLVGILLIEAIMTTETVFRDVYNGPLIIASFGATAILIYGAVDSPLAQPRNVFGGHIISAIVGVAITRLFVLDDAYMGYLENRSFPPGPFFNAGICMSTAILAQFVTGTVHPP
jgi:hypothetical protein